MTDAKTEKQKVKEITDKLEEGLKELFESEKYKSYLSTIWIRKYRERSALKTAESEFLPVNAVGLSININIAGYDI